MKKRNNKHTCPYERIPNNRPLNYKTPYKQQQIIIKKTRQNEFHKRLHFTHTMQGQMAVSLFDRKKKKSCKTCYYWRKENEINQHHSHYTFYEHPENENYTHKSQTHSYILDK